ncbi:MAG: peptidylprolyl isomerase [bacterium]
MKVFRLPLLFFASFVLCFNTGRGSDNLSDSNTVAKYDNDRFVTVSQLNKYIEDWLYYKKFIKRADIYNNAINDLLVNQFKRMDFFEKGLDKDTKLLQSINRIISEELVAEYFETQYVEKYANAEYAKKIYAIMDKTVAYQLIVLNKPENASQEQLDSLKEKAMTIHSEIENGGDFASLVKKYSQNETTIMNNGFMPPVDWKRSISDPVDEVIFQLPKDDVKVLNSEKELLIVKITDVNKIRLEPFDSLKSQIISDLKIGFEELSISEYEKDKKALINEDNLKWNEAALKQIVQWSTIPHFYVNEYKNTFKTALESGDNKIILTYDDGTVDYKELLRLLDNVLILKDTYEIKEEDIKNFMLEAIRTDLIVKKAEALDLKKNIFHAFTANPALRNEIGRLYNQAEVEAKIPEPKDEALHQFFKENENGLFYQLEKINLFVMVLSTKDDADKVCAKINSGTPFEKVTGSYLVKTYIKERDGEIKSFLSDEEPTFGKVAFEMKESEVSKPIEFQDENGQPKYAVVKCYRIRPEKQLTFDDVTDTITDDFKEFHRKKIGKEVEERLKNKYHPEINEEVLVKLISHEK